MMSPKDTSLEEEEGADVGRSKRDGGVESCCRDLNCASQHFMVVASMAHMKVKGLDVAKGMEKWRTILMIAEGKMSLSRDAES